MRLLPKSLVGRNALFVTVILVLNALLWFNVIRPLVFNQFVAPDQVYHPDGMRRVYLELEWALFALIICTLGVYLIFHGLRRQLRDVREAARALGEGRPFAPLAESGPDEIRELSRGFNLLATNLEALAADRRLMLAGISHDLSTPLTRLRLALELMRMKEGAGQAADMIRDIEDMDAILTQFSNYASSGKEEDPAVGDLNELVIDASRRHAAAGTTVATDLAAIPLFSFRPLAVRRMLANLLENANRYGGGNIEVSTRLNDNHAMVAVMDRGPGIRRVEPSSLIKPFAREDASRGKQPGAGLGLTIVDRIARSHGGELTLANRPGGGLAVTVTLPLRC